MPTFTIAKLHLRFLGSASGYSSVGGAFTIKAQTSEPIPITNETWKEVCDG